MNVKNMVTLLTRTIEQTPEDTSSYSVTPTYLPLVIQGVAQQPSRMVCRSSIEYTGRPAGRSVSELAEAVGDNQGPNRSETRCLTSMVGNSSSC